MKTIARYEIIGFLGRGGMSKVYKVKLPFIKKIAALKCFEPSQRLISLIGLDKLRELFISEASIISNLRHPNIIDIYFFEEIDSVLYYLMEYFCHNLGVMMGETYWADARSRMIPFTQATEYILQILEGLCRLHHAGIVHRDIKPFNIMLTDTNKIKIADFGLSKLRGEQIQLPDQIKVGTAMYAAPEQIESPDHVDFSADLYSVGMIYYRMLTGFLPDKNRVLPSQVNRDLNTDLDYFLLKSIDSNSKSRFQTASEMKNVLLHLYNHWVDTSKQHCALQTEDNLLRMDISKEQQQIRSSPLKLDSTEARDMFGLDELWRPQVWTQNHFKNQSNGTVVDKTTGLIWQYAGSDYTVTYSEAEIYIIQLNQIQFAGYKHWRLPTVNELLTLLTPVPHGDDFCIEPVFSPEQKWLWSSDYKSFKSVWFVNMQMGFVSWHDIMGFYYAKAVCDDSI
ncbi:MAG: protein kinase [Desulfobacterales bacterium]|nr:protein kinase [Desulfobacterales bacterium]